MLELDFRVTFQAIQLLAEGNPVAPESLAEAWELPLDQVHTILRRGKENGSAELDDQGNLIVKQFDSLC